MRAQEAEIDQINRSSDGGFRVLKGLETNILADGGLDVSPDERRGLDVVLAAPHSKLRSTDDQTGRLIRAAQTRGVHVLAHPRGRMSDSREGVRARWDEVFGAAAEAGTAVEIDGDPARQDLDYSLARLALDLGCIFALDSDAHSPDQLVYAETAIAHARLAGIPAAKIINCWPLPTLVEWLSAKSP
jgi:histidinol phosphatase-like PHP family hydrolase